MKYYKRRKNIFLLIWLLLYILFIVNFILISLLFRYSYKKRIKDVVVVQYGSSLDISDFVNDYKKTDVVTIEGNIDDYKDIGEYKINIIVNRMKFKVNLIVKDTLAPVLEVRNLEKYLDEDVPTVKDFIVNSFDLNEYNIEEVYPEKKEGVQTLTIRAVDKYGNETIKQVNLTWRIDKDAPIITGLEDIVINMGDTVDLISGVQAIDERYGNVSFKVDDSQVNYQKEGIYKIIYQAEDNLGNKAIKERKIIINEPDITYMINDFPVYKQYPDYPNGCESVALYNLLKYYKVDVSIEKIVDKLKKGDKPYKEDGKLYGGNPEIEFVGDPRDIHGYGVFQKPIIDVAKQFKEGIIDYSGHDLEDVLKLVKNNIPVQVWVSINLRDTEVCTYWIDKKTKQKIEWICDLHSVIIVGYNNKEIIVSDSYVGQIVKYERKQFEKIFNLFGKRAIYYET